MGGGLQSQLNQSNHENPGLDATKWVEKRKRKGVRGTQKGKRGTIGGGIQLPKYAMEKRARIEPRPGTKRKSKQ